jgi:hypothetical protein
VKIVKNERDPPLFTGKLLIKFQNIPTVHLAKKSVVVRWEIVGNWLDHN